MPPEPTITEKQEWQGMAAYQAARIRRVARRVLAAGACMALGGFVVLCWAWATWGSIVAAGCGGW